MSNDVRRFICAYFLISSALFFTACTTDLGIDELAFTCDIDADCGDGFVCAPAADGRDTCQSEDQVFEPDAGEPDAELDAEPDAESDADVSEETWYDDIVFLSTTGNDENSGLTPDSPVATFSLAVDIADDERRSQVYLSQGAHIIDIILDDPVSLFGGRDEENDWAETDEMSELRAGSFSTTLSVIREDGESAIPTLFSHLLIEPPDMPEEAGTSVSTLRLSNIAEGALVIRNSVIRGGEAAQGKVGEAGTDGNSGNEGAPGTGGSTNVFSESVAPGGEGGAAPQCDFGSSGVLGGTGGESLGCRADDGAAFGEGGAAGQPNIGASGGDGGEGGRNRCEQNDPVQLGGTLGEPGGPGGLGEGGSAGASSIGIFESGTWSSDLIGTVGTHGNAGAGGGGGGAGGGRFAGTNSFDFGGGGGGGGSGGCGGEAGHPGHPGGASFALLLVDAHILFQDVEIIAGAGGEGGPGGPGGCGSAGGEGNDGGAGSGTAGLAGSSGGDGGPGGNGGGGPGGHGGPLIGIALVENSTYNVAEDSQFDRTGFVEPGAPGGPGGTTEECEVSDDGSQITGEIGPTGMVEMEVNFDEL